MSLEQVSSPPVWTPEVVIGDIEAGRYWTRTPAGVVRTKDVTWNVVDLHHTQRVIPNWALVFAVLGCVFFFLGLLFLFVREDRTTGEVQVAVSGPNGYYHVVRIPIKFFGQVADVHMKVSHARSLAAAL